MTMDDRSTTPPEGRRAFFRTLGRGLVLGATGVGVTAMIRNGSLNVTECIDEHGPCRRCVLVVKCDLPKAETFKKDHPHG